MASSVLNAERAIHPVVGSIFSAPTSEGSLETPVVEESILSQKPRAETRRSFPSGPPVLPASENRPRLVAERIDENLAGTVAAKSDSADSPLRPSIRAGNQNIIVRASRAAAEPKRQVASPTRVAQPEPDSAARSYIPLVTGDFNLRKPGDTAIVVPKSPHLEQRPLPSSRTGDDVEIHIGRIEITAMHPQVSRAVAPKPVRRAQTLDEYLKRRDGRVP